MREFAYAHHATNPSPDPDRCFQMHRCLAVPVPTLRLQDSLSECYITGRCLPAMTPRVLVMGDEVRTEENFFRRTITINSFTGRSQSSPFDQNLLIPLDFARLRQMVIKLVSRLLTEMLEVRILPGEPTPFSRREVRTFSGNCPRAMKCQVHESRLIESICRNPTSSMRTVCRSFG